MQKHILIMWIYEFITDWDTFWNDENKNKLDNIFDSSYNSHPFYHSSILYAWYRTYTKIRKLTPLCVWAASSDGNIGLLPLIIWQHNYRGLWIRRLTTMGCYDFDYHDPIFLFPMMSDLERNDFWKGLVEILLKLKIDIIDLDGFHDSDISLLRKENCTECPCICLDSENLYSLLNRKARQNLNRHKRQLEEIGNVCVFRYNGSDLPDAIDSLSIMLEHHRKTWPNAYKAPGFHVNLITDGLSSGILDFSELRLNGNPISWKIALKHKDIFYSYMSAYDNAYSRFSPGKIHQFECISNAAHSGFKVYDMLRGSENYKKELSNVIGKVYDYKFYGNSVLSKCKINLSKFKSRIL